MKLLKVLALTWLILMGCGRRVDTQVPRPSDSMREQLANKLQELYPTLLKCDGGPSDSSGNPLSGRPNCDTGDSIAPVGFISTAHFEPGFDEYLANSIGADGRPYRSPEHRQLCEGTDKQDTDGSCNFSRDHFIGHMMYAVSTKNSTHLKKILGYMDSHSDQICVGSFSQCSLTPAVWDVLGDTLSYLDLPRPVKTYVPDIVSVIAEEITLANSSEYQLALIAEVVHIKILTGNFNSNWIVIVDKLNAKQPNNLYFNWLRLATSNPNSGEIDTLVKQLLDLIDRRIAQGPGTVWLWSWIDEPQNMNGWELFALGKLLLSNSSL